MNKDTIIKVLLAIIALMVFAWLWRIISGMQQQARAAFSSQTMPWDSHSLFLSKELYGKHNNSNRKHNLNDKRNQHRQQ